MRLLIKCFYRLLIPNVDGYIDTLVHPPEPEDTFTYDRARPLPPAPRTQQQ